MKSYTQIIESNVWTPITSSIDFSIDSHSEVKEYIKHLTLEEKPKMKHLYILNTYVLLKVFNTIRNYDSYSN